MMKPMILAAALAAAFAAPAFAQTPEPDAAPMPLNDGTMSNATGKPLSASSGATGTPGVGLDASEGTEGAGAPKGPGGLQNGVGGEGTLAPSTTGSNNDILDTQPAGEPGEGGIALPLTPAAPAN